MISKVGAEGLLEEGTVGVLNSERSGVSKVKRTPSEGALLDVLNSERSGVSNDD